MGRGLRESLGWSKQVTPGQHRFRFGFVVGRAQHRKDGICLWDGYTRGGPNRVAAVPLSFALKPHNSYSPPLAPPELLSLSQSPGFVPGYESVCAQTL